VKGPRAEPLEVHVCIRSSGSVGGCSCRAASPDGVRHHIRGTRNGLSVYKGIPFAAPPVGDLRWRAPVHAATWTGTRKEFLLANAERVGDKYVASLRVTSLQELRQLPATLLTGNAGGIVHAVIEPYVLPLSPYEAFASGQQNDVPLLIGSNADEARAIVDVTHETAATFDNDLERSVGPLPPALVAAYPHATDEEARQAQLGLERDLRFGWDMWAWARLQAGTGKSLIFYYSFRQQPPFPVASVYAGWGASHFAELWYVFDHLDQWPWNWTATDRKLAEEMSSYWVNFVRSGDPNSQGLPPWPAFTSVESKVRYLGDPISVGGVANIHGLSAFDAVYSTVRGKPFAAR
jgi:para-nitrobenzyl esterase